MTEQPAPVLALPAMLQGTSAAIIRAVSAEGRWWAREYRKTGVFPPPRQLRQVLPGEVLVVDSGAAFDMNQPGWWLYLFSDVFMYLHEGVSEEERPRMKEGFESFCLSTPWGALHYAVSPPPLRSAARMANRLAAVLRFWDVLRGPRYAFRPYKQYTLEELLEDIYGETLRAWCPGASVPIREHLVLAAERMSRATREECLDVLLRLIPVLVKGDRDLNHHETLSDPDFLHERLLSLPLEDFEEISSGYTFSVAVQTAAWDRSLGRH